MSEAGEAGCPIFSSGETKLRVPTTIVFAAARCSYGEKNCTHNFKRDQQHTEADASPSPF